MLTFLAVFTSLHALANESTVKRRVMTWVPPYSIKDCKQRLNESFGRIAMKNALTHIGLQFWQPTTHGGIKLVSRFKQVTEAEVIAFRRWGKANGVRVMLCIYNATNKGWDWNLATQAFKTNRKVFIDALVKETIRLKLDGVDIDLEGKGNQDATKEAFIRFIKELSVRLHAKDKELTVNTFAYKWHAPNQRWWPALLPHVDALQVMGYTETGAGAAAWRGYAFIRKAGGKHASKLVIGMPGKAGAWLDTPLSKHLEWVAKDPSVGLAIWDARLTHPAWRTEKTWRTITKIKTSGGNKRRKRMKTGANASNHQ